MHKKKPINNTRPRQAKRTLPERSGAFSYHANRAIEEHRNSSSRQADPFAPSSPPGITWWKQIPMIAAGLVIIICIVDTLLLTTSPRVVLLGNTSNQLFLRPESVYAHAAEQLLAGSILNRNKLTINANGVSLALERQFPELASASVTLPLIGHRPVVYVEPETPSLILASQGGGTFIVSQSGKALISTNELSKPESLKLPVVTDQSGLGVQLGKPTLPTANVSFIQTVVKQFQAQQLTISSLILPAGGSEFDVHLTGQLYFVKFNLESEVNQQVGTFIAVKNYVDTHHLTPSQYIDVRVVERAYYK